MNGREAHRGPRKMGACSNEGSAYQAKRRATQARVSRWARLVRQTQAPSRGFHTVLTVEGDRGAGLKKLSAQPHLVHHESLSIFRSPRTFAIPHLVLLSHENQSRDWMYSLSSCVDWILQFEHSLPLVILLLGIVVGGGKYKYFCRRGVVLCWVPQSSITSFAYCLSFFSHA